MVLAQGLLLCAYTVTTIAVLKRAGWITVHPRNVKNERVRKVFEAAITLGDTIVCKSVEMIDLIKGRGSEDGRTPLIMVCVLYFVSGYKCLEAVPADFHQLIAG
ncbi:unnamed protein product [Sphagnum jensenii]|uniref:Uncharacterized protein n=1 Tax=Sphagnum jensenii TaxID=128206 RepID=A0ABP1AM66_9BRYO